MIMRKLAITFIASAATVGLLACDGGPVDSDLLVENSIFVAALEIDGETLDDVPEGVIADGAEESVDSEDGAASEPARDCSLGAIRRRVVATYDADENGRLDETERGEFVDDFGPRPLRRRHFARHHMMQRLRWIYDADNSRSLDDAERAEMRNDLEMRCANRQAWLLEQYDADNSGDLSNEEWQAARDALVARRQAHRENVLDRFDTDDSGDLSEAERAAAREAMKQRMQERREGLRDTFDTDDSGDLDDAERDAAREALKSRVRGEHFGA